MLSATLREGLDTYDIGGKVRMLRLKKKMGLVQLGQHTGLSPALLSKIERSRLFPPLPTLLRIALVFGVGLDFFFVRTGHKPFVTVVRKADRVTLPAQPGAHEVAYQFESLDYPATERPFSAYFAEFFPVTGEALELHEHPGFELIYVLQGRLAVRLDAVEHFVNAGDSMYFDSTAPHAYRRADGRVCRAIVVTTS